MRTFLATIFLALGLAAPAWALDPVLNDTNEAYTTFTRVVEHLGPQAEAVAFLKNTRLDDAETFKGGSVALYTAKSQGYDLASLRIGMALETETHAYGTLQMDIPGLCGRYLPPSVKDFPLIAMANPVWGAIDRYLNVGAGPGYDKNHDKWGVALTVGASW